MYTAKQLRFIIARKVIQKINAMNLGAKVKRVAALPGGIGSADFGDIGAVNAQKLASTIQQKPQNSSQLIEQAVAAQVTKEVRKLGGIPSRQGQPVGDEREQKSA